MKALRLSGPPSRSKSASSTWKDPKVILENVPKPEPKPGELLIRVRYCGLCGSDFHLAEGAYPGLAALPVTLGHEFSGTVEGYGPGTDAAIQARFPIGEPVTAEEMQWCGSCEPCRSGHVNHCDQLEEIGFTLDGAHGEYLCVNAKYCWSLSELKERVGEENAFRLGAMVEPYSVAFRALFQGAHGGRWLPGSKVLVIGAGPIGLATADLALIAGALEVSLIEPVPARRELARKLGAKLVVDTSEVGQLHGHFDWIVDAAGAAPLVHELVISHLSIGGSVCLLARTDDHLPIHPESLITKNARIFGSQGHSGEGTFGRVIRLMSGNRLRALDLIEGVISLEEAAERLERKERCGGKILVQPR